jgi:hypothetical protein
MVSAGRGYHRRVTPELGRILLVVGLLIASVGLLVVLGFRLPLGRLPGDIVIGGERGGIFIPIATSIVISIVLTLIVNLLIRR